MFIQAMHAELEGNLPVWACPFPDGHGELNGFEVHEIGRKGVIGKGLAGCIMIKMRSIGERDGLDTQLALVEQFVRHILQFDDAVLLHMVGESVAPVAG